MLDLKEATSNLIKRRRKQGLWKNICEFFSTMGLNTTEDLINNGYVPQKEASGNPILKSFVWAADLKDGDLKETYPEVKWTLVCHRHQFVGQFRPKYYGDGVVNVVNCPFCPIESAFSVKLTQQDMDGILSGQRDRKSYIASNNHYTEDMTEEEAAKVTGQGREGKYLFVNTTWKRSRHYYRDYIHRWKYVNGIAVRVDSSTKGDDVYDSITD